VALRKNYKPSQITAEYSVDLQVLIMSACPTVDCCAKVESPTLSILQQAYPAFSKSNGENVESVAISWMQGHLIAVSSFCNVREKMSDWQLKALCQQILTDYPTTTMVEFVLFCARLRSGMYEDFYGSVDPMRIIKSFRSFQEDRRRDYCKKYDEERQAKVERELKESREKAVGRDWLEKQINNGKLQNVAKLMGIKPTEKSPLSDDKPLPPSKPLTNPF